MALPAFGPVHSPKSSRRRPPADLAAQRLQYRILMPGAVARSWDRSATSTSPNCTASSHPNLSAKACEASILPRTTSRADRTATRLALRLHLLTALFLALALRNSANEPLLVPYTVSQRGVLPKIRLPPTGRVGGTLEDDTATDAHSRAGSPGTLTEFIATLLTIVREARENPEVVKSAPSRARHSRLDETRAARHPVLRWQRPD